MTQKKPFSGLLFLYQKSLQRLQKVTFRYNFVINLAICLAAVYNEVKLKYLMFFGKY